MFWTNIKRMLSRGGGISYTELDKLDIHEVFRLIVICEKEINGAKKNN